MVKAENILPRKMRLKNRTLMFVPFIFTKDFQSFKELMRKMVLFRMVEGDLTTFLGVKRLRSLIPPSLQVIYLF